MVEHLTAILAALLRGVGAGARRLRHSQAGEGVISTAIAVLVIAFLGVGMWVAFSSIFQSAETKVEQQINEIGG